MAPKKKPVNKNKATPGPGVLKTKAAATKKVAEKKVATKKVAPKKQQKKPEPESQSYHSESDENQQDDQTPTPRRGSAGLARRLNFTKAQNSQEDDDDDDQLQSAASPQGFLSDEDEENEFTEEGLTNPQGSSTQKILTKRTTKQSKAGIVFPVTRVKNNLKDMLVNLRISENAAVYIASVLEYLCSEVLELSGEVTMNRNKIRITPRDLMMTIKSDEELDKLMGNVTFANSGVPPRIEPSLLPGDLKRLKASKKKGTVAASNANFVDEAGPSGIQKQATKRKGQPTKEQGGKKIKQTTARPVMSDSDDED